VSEEVRFFLRTALYTGLIATVYWFVSYEWAGAVMLAFLFGSSIFFVVVTSVLVKSTRPPRATGSRRGVADTVRAVVGFEHNPAVEPQAPLEIEDDRFPSSSIWPLALSIAVMLVTLGLIYGPWLWIPGAGLLAASGLAWATQLTD
jgi:hypothetical protein